MTIPMSYRWEIDDSGFFCFAKLVIEQDAPGAPLEDTMAPLEETLHGLGGSFGFLYWSFTLRGLRRKIRKHEKREGFIGEEVFTA